MTRLILFIVLATPLIVSAQIYKTTDLKGNVVYTDQPPADASTAEEVDLGTTNTLQPPPKLPQPTAPIEDVSSMAYSVNIVSPAQEATIPNGPGNFSVTVAVNPALRPAEGLQLYIDGEARGEPQQDPLWELTNVFRGAHDLAVSVINSDGESVATSLPVRIYVHRPSINFNRNR
ncbi:MAG: DUF4124 domain-containing protein [Halieaceae bacterium]|nr:DUF4124 domain-containing protein [Halieaceae bacterium]